MQYQLVRSIAGFEKAHITRPGYAIEYDFFDPRDLKPSLETRHVPGLFFAGQINGTTGYEEAAAQGLIAGLNAVRYCREEEAWAPRRDEAYIGVLTDDLITSGTKEPYRMFTSRAEYRLMLREDNADLRLTPKGRELGLVDDVRWASFEKKQNQVEQELQRLRSTLIRPADLSAEQAESILGGGMSREQRLDELIKRPGVNYVDLMQLENAGPGLEDEAAAEQVEIQIKYAGYIDRQNTEIEKARRHEETALPEDLDYSQIHGLSAEVCEKLSRQRPVSIGQASRIPGITPAAISLLLVHLKKKAFKESA